MLHIVADESLEEAALFIASRCNNINYTNKIVREINISKPYIKYFYIQNFCS